MSQLLPLAINNCHVQEKRSSIKYRILPITRSQLYLVCQAPLSIGILQEEYWSGLPFPSLGDLPDPGNEPGSPALQADSSPSVPPGKPILKYRTYITYYILTIAHKVLPARSGL